MIFLLLWALSVPLKPVASVQEVERFELETEEPIEKALDHLFVNDHGEIFLSSYFNSKILMFDANGKFKKTVAGPGRGPGEVLSPDRVLVLDGKKHFLVIEGDQPLAHVFNFTDGKYIKSIRGFQPGNNWASNGTGIAALCNGSTSKKMWYVYDDALRLKSKFGNKEELSHLFYSRRFAMAYDKNGVVYYQEGSEPTIHIYEPGHDDYREWKLTVPEHYRKFEKPMDTRKTGFDRKKSYEHMISFTHLNRLTIWANDIMIVDWLTWAPDQNSIAFYDLKTKMPLPTSIKAHADLIAVNKEKLYILECIEDAQSISKNTLVVYKLKKNPEVYASKSE